MSATHKPEALHTHPTNKAREVFAVLLALPAIALTAFAAYVGFDLATSTLVGDEVGVAQVIVTVGGLLAVLIWTAVVALHKSARRDLRPGPRRLMVIGLASMLGFFVLARVLFQVLLDVAPDLNWPMFSAYALVVASGVTAFIASLRA